MEGQGSPLAEAMKRQMRLQEVRQQLEHQRMNEDTAGGYRPNTDMQLMQVIQGVLGGGRGLVPPFSMGRTGDR